MVEYIEKSGHPTLKIEYTEPDCIDRIANYIEFLTQIHGREYDKICIFCIGTDRCIYDALGPLVGHKLSKRKIVTRNVNLIGTLRQPAHALNLDDMRKRIPKNSLVIAIDASVGSDESLGLIYVSNSKVSPGSGTNKDLGSIGDISIKAITISHSDSLLFGNPSSTRLSFVNNLSEAVYRGIHLYVKRRYDPREIERNQKMATLS